MNDNSKSMGDIAEAVAAAELLKNKYVVSRPLSDNAPYDLIYDDGKMLQRAQVKGRFSKGGRIAVELYCSARSYSNTYQRGDFDCIIVVDMSTYDVALIKAEELFVTEEQPKYSTLILRRLDTMTAKTKNSKVFEDYLIRPNKGLEA